LALDFCGCDVEVFVGEDLDGALSVLATVDLEAVVFVVVLLFGEKERLWLTRR
jgi:hypothetical protein